MNTVTILLAAFAIVAVHQAQSQGLTAVRPIPGYECMRLNLTHDQIMDRTLDLPVFSEPSLSSARVGQASATVITKSPPNIRDGFAEILFLDGRPGWIQQKLLMPYATAARPNAHCTPSIMSNGKPGFG